MAPFRSRTRSALLVLLLLAAAPLAAAQAPLPPLEGAPQLPPPSTRLSIQEEALTFEGRVDAPTRIEVRDADGAPAFRYETMGDGRARVTVGGETLVEDATFVRIDGHPLLDSFTLVVRDAEGNEIPITIDREALAANLALPPEAQLPAVAVERPVGWPHAPQKGYLHHVQDAAAIRLGAAELDGRRYLGLAGAHAVTAQVPAAEMEWDRILAQVRREGQPAMLNVTLAQKGAGDVALAFAGSYAPSMIQAADGETMSVQLLYERRLTPLVVERLPEPATHRYRLDGMGPSVAISAPEVSDGFSFQVSWNGADGASGLGGFEAFYREAGATQWTRWLSTAAKSAAFSGAWGKTYEFRVRSYDAVMNPSAEYATATTRIVEKPTGTDDVNDAPTARFLSPRAGAALAGAVSVTWEARDPDGTPVTSRLEVSDDDGLTWRTIFAGVGQLALWDTARELDGAGYRLRLTVTDGTLSASDTLSALSVRNVAPPAPPAPAPGAPAPTGAPPASGGGGALPAAAPGAGGAADEPVVPASEEGGKKTPAPFVGLALLGAALLARRKGNRQL